tara:strand:- start:1540 stop:2214 length:675 start_codon:yes stop_codon:yes gene_type:complete
MTDQPLKGRVAVITGASRGIGAATAVALGAAGAKCVLLARTVGALEETDDAIRKAGGENALIIPQDLFQLGRLDQLGPALNQQLGRVDIFIGNAAMLGTLGPVAQSNPDMWEKCFKLNVLANQRLLRSLHPMLVQSDAGRVIFVSSSAAHKDRPHWGAYAASKSALEKMAKAYQLENEHTNIQTHIVDPGRVRTEMRALAYPGEDPKTLPTPDQVASRLAELAA